MAGKLAPTSSLLSRQLLIRWQEAATFPDWGKMNFREYPGKWWPDILPHADADAVDLVSNLVVFESGRRLSAEAALQHPYLQRD